VNRSEVFWAVWLVVYFAAVNLLVWRLSSWLFGAPCGCRKGAIRPGCERHDPEQRIAK